MYCTNGSCWPAILSFMVAENIKHPMGDSHMLPPRPLPAPWLSATHTVPVGREPWFSWRRVCVDGRDALVNSTLPRDRVIKVEKKRDGENVPQWVFTEQLMALSMNKGVIYSVSSAEDAFLVMRRPAWDNVLRAESSSLGVGAWTHNWAVELASLLSMVVNDRQIVLNNCRLAPADNANNTPPEMARAAVFCIWGDQDV